jgi:hypothetical protein
MTRDPQRGGALLVTMILISALMAGAAMLVSVTLGSSRTADLQRSKLSSLYCAEAGVVAARPVVAASYASWASALAASPSTAEPAWLAAGIGSHDLDGDGVADFEVYLEDNDDELPPAANDLTADVDLRIWIVSRCLKYPDTTQEVQELVQWSGGGTCYHAQGPGGCGGNGNTN